MLGDQQFFQKKTIPCDTHTHTLQILAGNPNLPERLPKQHQIKKVRHLVQNKLSKQKNNKNHSATDSLCLAQREYDDDDTKLWHNKDNNNDDNDDTEFW